MNKFRLSPHVFYAPLLLLFVMGVSARAQPQIAPTPTSPREPRMREETDRFLRSGNESRPRPSAVVDNGRQVKFLLETGRKALNASPPDYERAAAAYWHAADVNPKEVRAYEGLGEVYAAQALYDKAVQAYEEVVRIKPKRPEAHFTLGVFYVRAGRTEDALAKGRRLRELKKPELADKLEAIIKGG